MDDHTIPAAVQKFADEYRQIAAQVGGCGDGGCVIVRPTGMHTNGGCRCTYHMDTMRERGVTRLLRKAQQLVDVIPPPQQESREMGNDIAGAAQ